MHIMSRWTGFKRFEKQKEFEDTEQALEPDSDMKKMLELLGWKFKTIMINIHKTLMDKIDSMY